MGGVEAARGGGSRTNALGPRRCPAHAPGPPARSTHAGQSRTCPFRLARCPSGVVKGGGRDAGSGGRGRQRRSWPHQGRAGGRVVLAGQRSATGVRRRRGRTDRDDRKISPAVHRQGGRTKSAGEVRRGGRGGGGGGGRGGRRGPTNGERRGGEGEERDRRRGA